MHTPKSSSPAITLDAAPYRVVIRLPEARAALAVLVDRMRAMAERWERRRHARAAASVLRQLDGRTLRDIGFHRSEIESVAAELAGLAEPTRAHSTRSTSYGYWSRS